MSSDEEKGQMDDDTKDDSTFEADDDEAIDASCGAIGNYKAVLDAYARLCFAWNKANPASECTRLLRTLTTSR
jgi:hypothetical protein